MVNHVLELRGNRFVQASKINSGFGFNMNSKIVVNNEHIIKLKEQLEHIIKYWENKIVPFDGIFISVNYNKIVAKSNRISGLFKGKDSTESIVGAKYNSNKTKHIITYYLNIIDLTKSIELLNSSLSVLNTSFEGKINKSTFDNNKRLDSINFENFNLSKSKFKQVISDLSYIESFKVNQESVPLENSIVTIFKTEIDTKDLLNSLGINIIQNYIIDDTTVLLNSRDIKLLNEKAPYLISMATTNISTLSPSDFTSLNLNTNVTIPDPTIEPTIGVIDTLFDENVYFSKWVDYHEYLNKEFSREEKDYMHGTAVSSIIVDGPTLNPDLEDNCGRFKVRHFGVSKAGNFSSYTIIKQIKEIVTENPDIKVWNFSLGSYEEVNDNFISAEAAILDQIQFENDVIFVIAGTNNFTNTSKKIGSPADSINSLVVSSVDKDNQPATYSREGLALSFFTKPDISYYGGDSSKQMTVWSNKGQSTLKGTSLAAPWIARKLSYLIDILGLNRAVAKALIIDSARGWNSTKSVEEIAYIGHGIVPIDINEIISTPKDEIRFLVSDISEKWNTYNFNFPIPMKDSKYPYVARATMCYFPKCERTQGVDYTNTELNLQFGRITDDGKIKDIKGDTQYNDEYNNKNFLYIFEDDARSAFRKWDNVKYKSERLSPRSQSKKSYTSNSKWGMSIKTTNRLNKSDGQNIRFGVVVTLKEINGINRIGDFIQSCNLNGWIVNELNIQVRQEIQQKVNEEIQFQ